MPLPNSPTIPGSFTGLPSAPTPLWAINAFSFLNSFGTGVITNGIYFVTKNTYKFSQTENYFLGVVIGVLYVAATLLTGRAMGALRARGFAVTGRATLALTMVLLGVSCVMPTIGTTLYPVAGGAAPPSWPVWVMVLMYIPLTGVLWPIIESYVSGGRRGEDLRSSMGTWNFVWSGATAVALWTTAPLIEKNAPMMILLLGATHLAAGGLLRWFALESAVHAEDHEPHPQVYEKLLVTFRILLPTSYIFNTALGPFLPAAMTQLGVAVTWQPVIYSIFAVGRALTFYLAGRIHAWHGRWSTPIVAGVLMFGGFAAALLSPLAANGAVSWLGISILGGGLAVFAVGMALNYTAAIYYAMAVGNAEVDAGGKHEALIGVGYTVGPLCGLVPAFAIDQDWLAKTAFEPFVLSAVGCIGLIAAGLVIHRVWKHA